MISEQDKRSLHDRISKGRPEKGKGLGGCWLWVGRGDGPSKGWYTTVVIGGVRYNLRRLLYTLHHGLSRCPDRTTRLVSRCHNPRCVNPRHLTATEVPDARP